MEIEELRRLAYSFFEWPTEDHNHVTLTSALLFAQHVLSMAKQQQWNHPDIAPSVKAGFSRLLVVAVRRNDGKVYSFPAHYLNRVELCFEDQGETSGNGWTHEYGEEMMIATGWHDYHELDDYYEPLLNDGAELLAWCEMPQFGGQIEAAQQPVQPDQDRLRFKSACEISGDKHPEYVRGYEAAMNAVCRARKQQAAPVGVVREFHVDWRDHKPPEGTELYSYGSLGPSLLEQSDLEFIAARLGRVAKRVGYPMPSGDAQFIVSVSGSILGEIARILDGDTREKQAQPAPIPTSDRLPTEADADCDGRVWVYGLDKNRWIMTHWMNARRCDYWLPTGLKMPPAPGGEG